MKQEKIDGEVKQEPSKKLKKKREKGSLLAVSTICVILSGLIFLAFMVSISIGSSNLPLSDVWSALIGQADSTTTLIVFNLRMPRAVMAIIIGACLAVSGALLQAVMRNPLADPGTIGVSAGASTCAITIMLVFPTLTTLVPAAAFIGALVACVLIYAIAWKNGTLDPVRIILVGVAVNAVLGGYNSLLQLFNSDNLTGVLSFMNGSLSVSSWSSVYICLAYGSVGLILAFCAIKTANTLLLGEEMTKSLGIHTGRSRIFLSAISAFLAAATVSVVGMIGFVGLIVPHIGRTIVGSNYKALIPVSVLLGALLLLVCDTVGRVILPSTEIPVGIVMAVLGGPFFLYMLRKRGISNVN